MAFQPVANVVLASIEFEYSGKTVSTGIYLDNGAPADLAALQNIDADLFQWLDTDVKPTQVVGSSITGWTLYALDSESAPKLSTAQAVPIAGGGPGAPVPSNVALNVTFQAAGRGRSSRGYSAHPYLAESQIASNAWLQSYANTWETIYSAINSRMLASGATHVIVQRYENGVQLPAGISKPVLQYIGRTRAGTRRTRV